MSLQGKNFLTATRLKLMKFVPLLLPGHFLIDSDWARQPRRSVFWQSWNNDWFSTPVWNLILSKETRIC
jgi:hypothetical protein